jgi:hypothetical protein
MGVFAMSEAVKILQGMCAKAGITRESVSLEHGKVVFRENQAGEAGHGNLEAKTS